jgi:hypothetical protein
MAWSEARITGRVHNGVAMRSAVYHKSQSSLSNLDPGQVEVYRFNDNHLYVSSKWLAHRFPYMSEMLGCVEGHIKRRFQFCDATCISEAVQ